MKKGGRSKLEEYMTRIEQRRGLKEESVRR